MKQRIRGLVSLHEIPFPLASYKGKKAIVHIVQKEEERELPIGVGGLVEKKKSDRIRGCFLSPLPDMRRSFAWLPPHL